MAFSDVYPFTDELTTTDATPTTVGDPFLIPTDTTVIVDVQAVCIKTDGSKSKTFNVRRAFGNDDDAVTPSDQEDLTGPVAIGTGLDAVAVAINDDGTIKVTGIAATNLNWRVDRQVLTLAGAASSPDIESLPWTGFWYGDFTTANPAVWAATASGGASGSNGTLSESTNRPGTSGSLGGHTGADFDGTNDALSAAHPPTTFLSANAWTIAALFNADTAGVQADSDVWDNPQILADGAGCTVFVGFSDAGVKIGQYDSTSYKSTVKACTANAPHLLIAWFDGTNLHLEIDGVAGAPAFSGPGAFSGSNLKLGPNYTGTKFFDGKVYFAAVADVALSQPQRQGLLHSVNTRFGTAF